MNKTGKKQLVNSLAKVIEQWAEDNELNTSKANDVGYVNDNGNTWRLMAEIAVTALELNSDSQRSN